MKNLTSFTGANYFARSCGFRTQGWGQGASATRDHFRPSETYRERFSQMISDVAALGFDAFDLWEGQLDHRWATLEHLEATRDILKEKKLVPASLAMTVGPTPHDFEKACRFANHLGVPLIYAWDVQALEVDRAAVAGILRDHKVRFALENHPEKSPDAVLKKIGDSDEDVIGVALDTGWFATQGYSAPKAIHELRGRIFALHLKDVLKSGSHDCCTWGDGVVDIEACVNATREIGYEGPLTIELEPYTYDPTPAIAANLQKLKKWMAI